MTAAVLFRLVSVQDAKDQLSILHDADDAYIERLIVDASQIVMDYIGYDSLKYDGWTDSGGLPLTDSNGDPLPAVALDSNGDPLLDSNGDEIPTGISIIPGPVRRATLVVIARLDADREGMNGDPLSPAVASLLARFRDPPCL